MKLMRNASFWVSCILVLAATAAAAAPNIPPSEMPGRERQRFQETPLDRFYQPQKKAKPLWRWDCEPPQAKRKAKPKRNGC